MTTKKKIRKKATKKKTSKKKVAKKPGTRKVIKRSATELTPELREEMRLKHAYPWPLRPHQQVAMDKFNAGTRRQGLFWARRSGKDIFGLSLARNEAQKRVGSYVHCFPKYSQARRALWQGVDPGKGANFIDVAFSDMEVGRNNTDMTVEFHNGSNWQLAGSDNFNRIVGSNIVGVVFSEWALCDERAWSFLRPMILENGGWAVFITTFRGRNHAWQMAQNLKDNPDWYIDIRGVDKIVDVHGKRIITDEMIQAERDSGMSEALIQQEYFCDPNASSDGAIYGAQVDQLRNDPKRLLADWDPEKPVYILWNFDLPIHASYVVIQPGDRPAILDADQLELTTLGDALAKVNTERWPIQKHYVTSDQRDMVSAMTDLGARPEVLPTRNGFIATTKTAAMLARVRMDGERCDLMLDALSGYVRRERFDAQSSTLAFAEVPLASWHARLVYPLECFASLDYADSDTWGQAPDYSLQDRAIKTVL